MPGTKAFVTKATVQCGHGATAAALSSNRKLTVSADPVLTETELLAATFPPGCSQTNTGSGQKPCTKVVSVSGAKASKLTVGGSPVILDSLSGTTDGLPKQTDLAGAPGQSRLTAS